MENLTQKSLMLITILCIAMCFGCIKKDTTEPVITIKGDNPYNQQLNSAFYDPGATASDNKDGDLSSQINTNSSVNFNVRGTYFVNYSVEDAAGNSNNAARRVNVVNEVENLEGTYSVTDSCNGSFYANYQQTITADSYKNKRIVFSKFANFYNNTQIYADIVDDDIYIPNQLAFNIGVQLETHIFEGQGKITSTGMIINYKERLSNAQTWNNCVTHLVKQ
ncbi:MAG: DUF5011 domain-containing protein [Bacteroidetes bacterium]|nr:DUF5011 domain-containing protein [Bacteroidota bacterium]